MSGMKWMRSYSSFGPLLRAVGVLSAVGILVTSVTYASLQSQQATLTGNSISSATADLRIGTLSATSTSFGDSRTGFPFTNVVPGGPAVPTDGKVFYLKNAGSEALALKVAVNSTVTNTSNVDLGKIFVQLTRVDTGAMQSLSLQSLIDSQLAGGTAVTDPLAAANTVAQYKMRVSMNADAFTGTGANVSIGQIDLVFSGTPVL